MPIVVTISLTVRLYTPELMLVALHREQEALAQELLLLWQWIRWIIQMIHVCTFLVEVKKPHECNICCRRAKKFFCSTITDYWIDNKKRKLKFFRFLYASYKKSFPYWKGINVIVYYFTLHFLYCKTFSTATAPAGIWVVEKETFPI